MSDSVRPHRQQPTRLPHSWDSPGKNTGVGCHFFLQCMKVKSETEVTQSCSTPSNPKDCSLPGSSVHGIFQARVLEWGAICLLQSPIYISINEASLRSLQHQSSSHPELVWPTWPWRCVHSRVFPFPHPISMGKPGEEKCVTWVMLTYIKLL